MGFVGRAEQLEFLHERFEEIDTGSANVALVRGIAGSGKSALVAEFLERIAPDAGATVAVVSCNQYAEESFSVFKRVVARLVESGYESKSESLRKRAAAMGGAMLEIGPAFVSLVFPPAGVVGDVGRYLLSQARKSRDGVTGVTAGYRESAREAFSDFEEFFRRAAGESKLVVVIDDLHWADEASIALFGRLATYLSQTPDVPILLVGSYRGHEVAANDEHKLGSILNQVTRYWGDVVVNLDEVGDGERFEVTKGIVERFSSQGLGIDFTDQLFKKSEGTPLVVKEFLEAMAAAGVLVETRDGDWVQQTAIDWDITPVAFDASVAERVKWLSAEALTVLKMAAVQGVEFSADVIAKALGHSLDDVLTVLADDLGRDRHGFVKDINTASTINTATTDSPVFKFRFQHAEYQRFIYESLILSIQIRSHAKIAAAMVDVLAGMETDVALEIAEQWAKAAQPARAAPYFLTAANSALDAGDLPGARTAALKGLAGTSELDPATEAELQLIAGRTNHLLGEYSAASSYLARALETSTTHGLAGVRTNALVWIGSNAWMRNLEDEAWECLTAGLSMAKELGDQAAESRALRNLGVLARRVGDANRALMLYEQSEHVAREAGLDAGVTASINNRALIFVNLLGDFERALELFEEALSIAGSAGNRSGQSRYHYNLAMTLSRLGNQDSAIESANDGLVMSRSIGNLRFESLCHVSLGIAYSRLARWEEAIPEFRRCLSVDSALDGNHSSVIWAHMRLAIAAAHNEDSFSAALSSAYQGVALHEETRRDKVWSTVYSPGTVLGVVLAISGSEVEAVEALGIEGQIIPSGGDPWWMRWQQALLATTRVVLGGNTGGRERCLRRIRLAMATTDAEGVVADARALVELLKPIAADRGFIEEVLGVLGAPSERSTPLRAIESDRSRLDGFAARYREIVKDTRLEPFRTPIDRDSAVKLALRDLDNGKDPVFEYTPVPPGIEAPMIDLLGDLDPARSLWEGLLYESVEDRLDLLLATRSRDASRLTKASIDAFGSPTKHLVREAKSVLDSVERCVTVDETQPAAVASQAIGGALTRLGLTSWRVVVDPLMNADMSVSLESETVRVREGAMFSRAAVNRLLVHEIGTHVFRAENGRRQPLDLLGLGLGQNLSTEEGLAAYNETRSGLSNQRTMRKYSLRVVAVDLVQHHGFSDVYQELLKHTDSDEAFAITMRAKRGLEDTSEPGGFIKDHVYLGGVIQIRSAIERDPDAYRLLMSAKVPLRLLDVLRDLKNSGILVEPAFMPGDLTI